MGRLGGRTAKTLVSVMIAALMSAVLASPASATDCTLDGSGISGDPFRVADAAGLAQVGSICGLNKAYKQTANITLSSHTPIGSSGSPFSGTYEGDGKTITGLAIDTTSDNIGLFGYAMGATFDGISLSNATVRGDEYVGALVGFADEVSILNSYVTGTSSVQGTAFVGGLVGYSMNTDTARSYSTASVTGGPFGVGGLLGFHETFNLTGPAKNITDSYATGDVVGTGEGVGGLVGYWSNYATAALTVSGSYATGNVSGLDSIGGLIGAIEQNDGGGSPSDSRIVDSYATGDVRGEDKVGGLVGDAGVRPLVAVAGKSSISGSYAEGQVTGRNRVGGLVGEGKESSIADSYATGDVSGASFLGGLVGSITETSVSGSTTIVRSHANGSVTGTGAYLGGLVGDLLVSTSDSFATGNVASTVGANTSANVGGLAGRFGYQNALSVEKSHATGTVSTAGDYAGGLFGEVYESTVRYSYSTGSVNGGSTVGGMVGYSFRMTLENSYSAGATTGNAEVGGLVGDADTSTVVKSYARGVVTGGTGLRGTLNGTVTLSHSAGLTDVDTFVDWAIVSAWEPFAPAATPSRVWGISSDINAGTPFLLWQCDRDVPLSCATTISAPSAAADYPTMALAANGSLVATAWRSESDSIRSIQARIGTLSESGLTWAKWEGKAIKTLSEGANTSDSYSEPYIAVSDDGRTTVVLWQKTTAILEEVQGELGPILIPTSYVKTIEAAAARQAAGVLTWGAPEVLYTLDQGEDISESISSGEMRLAISSGAGAVVATWILDRYDGSSWSEVIKGKHGAIQADGSVTWGGALVTLSQTLRDPKEVSLAVSSTSSGTNVAVLAWYEDFDDTVRTSSAIISGAGITPNKSGDIIIEHALNTTADLEADPYLMVDVSSDGSTAIAVFIGDDEADSGKEKAWAVTAKFTSGVPMWGASPVAMSTSHTSNYFYDAQVALTADGRKAVSIWEQQLEGHSYTSAVSAVATIANDGSMTWSAPVGLSVAGDDISRPKIAVAADGSWVASTWRQSGQAWSAVGHRASEGYTWESSRKMSVSGRDARVAVGDGWAAWSWREEDTIRFVVEPLPSVLDTTLPTITSGASSSVQAGATAVADLEADEEVTWSISGGADQALFEIVDGNKLRFKSPATPGTYTVIVKASDGTNETELTVTVTVSGGGSGSGNSGSSGGGGTVAVAPQVDVVRSPDGSVSLDFGADGSSGVTVAFDNATKTVPLKYDNGRVLIDDPKFSGKVSFDVVVTGASGAKTMVRVDMVVLPKAPTGMSAGTSVKPSTKLNEFSTLTTTLRWAPSPNATGYRVIVADKVVGTTAATSFGVKAVLGPKSKVQIVPLGNDDTSGAAVDVALPRTSVTIGKINFIGGRSVLTAAAKRQLNKAARLIVAQGFTQITLGGHTDNLGSAASSAPLSAARTKAVQEYLASRLSEVDVRLITRAYGDRKPIASNSSQKGRELNRRVDIAVR
jgi:outer membrane protein OmpA-like peptidoglycan-associated protein